MSNKEQIENLDEPTICDNCTHDDVCGLEGHLEPALKYCGWKSVERPQGYWKKDEWGNISCSNCGRDTRNPRYPFFCGNCGADMRGGRDEND